VCANGEDTGIIRDFFCDQNDWTIRYLQIEQRVDNRIILFHLLPTSVQRISWVASRVFLRELAPVHLQETGLGEFIASPVETGNPVAA
jgi:hypothetical protein